MDRNAIIGFVLIALILMIWMSMNAPAPAPPMTAADSVASVHRHADSLRQASEAARSVATASPVDTLGKYFGKFAAGAWKTITIETPHYRATLSAKGGGIHSWELKGFKTWDQHPVHLLDPPDGSDFSLLFSTTDGKVVNTKGLYFDTPLADGTTLTLAEGDSAAVTFTLPVADGSTLVKTLVFHGGTYTFDASYRFEGLQGILSNFEYQVVWESPVRYNEQNSVDESNHAHSGVYAGGEFTEADASDFDAHVHKAVSGRVSWVAARDKYFMVAMIPREKESNGAELDGVKHHMPDKGAKEDYSLTLRMPYTGKQVETDRFTVYMGPLEFDAVKAFGLDLDKMMSLGNAWVVRPIAENVIVPLFKIIHYVVPNYGFVLIIFAFIVKIALYPLTKSSMVSMRKMQKLQPEMNEIKEKYKDDPQKMNQAVMRLYKEYGVNPAGGCLPLILQLPILYSLWAVFSSTIELRQTPFFLWIHDLATPDVIYHLPFQIPLFGIDKLSGLALLMGVTMVIQQKQSVQDPRQKMMMWLMPVMMTLLFTGFPAGLNMYYFVFNVLSIGQQAWMNNQHKDEPLQKVDPKKSKGGIFTTLSKNMPKLPK